MPDRIDPAGWHESSAFPESFSDGDYFFSHGALLPTASAGDEKERTHVGLLDESAIVRWQGSWQGLSVKKRNLLLPAANNLLHWAACLPMPVENRALVVGTAVALPQRLWRTKRSTLWKRDAFPCSIGRIAGGYSATWRVDSAVPPPAWRNSIFTMISVSASSANPPRLQRRSCRPSSHFGRLMPHWHPHPSGNVPDGCGQSRNSGTFSLCQWRHKAQSGEFGSATLGSQWCLSNSFLARIW